MRTRLFPLLVLVLLVLGSCGSPEKPKKTELTKDQVNALSVQMNTWDADRQQDEIDQYISHHGWDMKETESGVFYMSMTAGSGDSARTGQTASVTYEIYLLDGTKCYTSGDTPKDIVIGEDYIESGLHEGLLHMHVGEQMRFILPSHLAHGLTGDQDKIPPRSSVVYEVKLLGLH